MCERLFDALVCVRLFACVCVCVYVGSAFLSGVRFSQKNVLAHNFMMFYASQKHVNLFPLYFPLECNCVVVVVVVAILYLYAFIFRCCRCFCSCCCCCSSYLFLL